MTRKILALSLVVSFSVAFSVGAQSQNSQQPARPADASQQAPPIRTTVETVIVPVTVKDSDGHLIGDLKKNDFRVFADRIEQQILVFTSDPFPLSAVILIDDDLPQKPEEQVQKSLTAISAGFGPNDEAALVTYDEFPNTVEDFSSNNDLLFTHLKRLELGSHSSTVVSDPLTTGPVINGNINPVNAPPTGQGIPAHGSGRYKSDASMNDALYAAGQMLKARGRDRRKIIFLISDGNNSRQNQHTYDETLHTLMAADVSVYSISVVHSVPMPVGKSLVEHGVSDLDNYAKNTGGDTFYAGKQEDLERLYSDVTEEARNQYTLTFSPHGADRTRDFHQIEVRVERPGLSVTTRTGYFQSAIGVGH